MFNQDINIIHIMANITFGLVILLIIGMYIKKNFFLYKKCPSCNKRILKCGFCKYCGEKPIEIDVTFPHICPCCNKIYDRKTLFCFYDGVKLEHIFGQKEKFEKKKTKN